MPSNTQLIAVFSFVTALGAAHPLMGFDNAEFSSNGGTTPNYSNNIESDSNSRERRVEADATSLQPEPTFSGQSINLSDYIEEHCQAHHPVLSECQKENSLNPLLSNTAILGPTRSEINPMTRSEVKALDGRFATNEELSRFREYLKSNGSVLINEVEQKIEKLSDKTPLLYQFFSRSADSKIQAEYVDVFRHNCRIEPDRRTVILTDSYYTNQHDRQIFEALAEEFNHVKLLDMSQLPDELHIDNVTVIRSNLNDGRPVFTIEHDDTDRYHQEYYDFWNYLDISRFFALHLCDQLLEGNSDEEAQGCIFMDWDFVLRNKIGEVCLPGGIACFIQDEFSPNFGAVIHSLTIENGLIAVSKAHHPAIKQVFTASANTPYASFVAAITRFFSENTEDKPQQVKVDCRIEIAPEDVISRGYLSSFQRRFGKKTEGKLIQWKGLQYDARTAWRQRIAFPVSECMVSDISRFLGISTWQSQDTPRSATQSAIPDVVSDEAINSGISSDKVPYTREVTIATRSLATSAQEKILNLIPTSSQENEIRLHHPKQRQRSKDSQKTLRLEKIHEEEPDTISHDRSPSPDQEEDSVPANPPRFYKLPPRHQYSLHHSMKEGSGNWTQENPVIAARSISRNIFHVAKARKTFGINEFSILTDLQPDMHENIANYLGTETDDKGEEYVILQRGGDKLGDIIRQGEMNQRSIDNYIVQLVNAVKYLHSKGIVHRDLNPGNILSSNGAIKICDFGLSLREDEESSGAVPLSYAPIEAYLGVNDASYDIWTIGCLLYELTTGVRLFSTEIIRPVARATLSARNNNTPLLMDDSNPHYQTLKEVIENAQEEIHRIAGEQAADFFARAMSLDYRERLTAQQAEQHPYIQTIESDFFHFYGIDRSLSTPMTPVDAIDEEQTSENNEPSRLYKRAPAISDSLYDNPSYLANAEFSAEGETPGMLATSSNTHNNPGYLQLPMNTYQNTGETNARALVEERVIGILFVPESAYENFGYSSAQMNTYQNISGTNFQAADDREVTRIPVISGYSYDNHNYLSLPMNTYQNSIETNATPVVEGGNNGISVVSGSIYENPGYQKLQENTPSTVEEEELATSVKNQASRVRYITSKTRRYQNKVSTIPDNTKRLETIYENVEEQKSTTREWSDDETLNSKEKNKKKQSSEVLQESTETVHTESGKEEKAFAKVPLPYAQISEIQHMKWLPDQNRFKKKIKGITESELNEILLSFSSHKNKKAVNPTVHVSSNARPERSAKLKAPVKKSHVHHSVKKSYKVRVTLSRQEKKAGNGKIMGHRYYVQIGNQGIAEIDKGTFNRLKQQIEKQKAQKTKRVTFASEPVLEPITEEPDTADTGNTNNREISPQQMPVLQTGTTPNQLTVERNVPHKKTGIFKTFKSVGKAIKSIFDYSDFTLDDVKVKHRTNVLSSFSGWGAEAGYYMQRNNASGDPMETRNAEDAAEEAEDEQQRAEALASCSTGEPAYMGTFLLFASPSHQGAGSSSNSSASNHSSSITTRYANPAYDPLLPAYSELSSVSGSTCGLPSYYSPSCASSSACDPPSYRSSSYTSSSTLVSESASSLWSNNSDVTYDAGYRSASVCGSSASSEWSDSNSFSFFSGGNFANHSDTASCANCGDPNMTSGYGSSGTGWSDR